MALPIDCIQEDAFSLADASVIKLQQNTESTHSVILREDTGTIYSIPTSATIVLYAKEWWTDTGAAFSIACSASSPTAGTVAITFPATATTYPRLMHGEIAVTDISVSQEAIKRFRCYIEVSGSLASTQYFAPLTISEIRLAMRDRIAEDNYLLDHTEFSNDEIVYAIRRPIDWWNSTVPDNFEKYTWATFPYRYQWLDAVIGELLRIAALNLSRNRLTIQGGGISTDDKARAELYLQLSNNFQEKWKGWAISKIRSLNMSKWFGYTVNSNFGTTY